MAASVLQSTKKYFSGASSTLAFGSNVAAGSLLICLMNCYSGNDGGSSVSDNVNGAYTKLYWANNGSMSCALFYKVNSGAGATTVTANCGDVGGSTSIVIIEAAGIVTSSPVDGSPGFDANTGSSTSPSGGPLTPTQTGDLLIGNTTNDTIADTSISTPTNYTELQKYTDGNSFIPIEACYRVYGSISADTVTWTLGASKAWVGAIAAFKAAPTTTFSDVPPTINRRNAHLFVR